MIIKVQDIPPEGVVVDVTENADAFSAQLADLGLTFLGPVSAHLELSRLSEEEFSVKGRLKALLSLACARCLKDFEHAIEKDFSLLFVTDHMEEHERELTTKEMDIGYIAGDEFDTVDIMLEQIALELTLQPLCTLDCKGLCPECGTNLNTGSCQCHKTKKVDPRLAKLKGLKTR